VTFGVKVGASAQQTPQISVGYDQLDAVILPLAMDGTATGNGSNTCQSIATSAENFSTKTTQNNGSVTTGHLSPWFDECKFVGSSFNNQHDAYSVYSNFGANVGVGDAPGTNSTNAGAHLNMAVAKIFATGVAAQTAAAALSGNYIQQRQSAQINLVEKITGVDLEANISTITEGMKNNGYQAEANELTTSCASDSNTCIRFIFGPDLSVGALISFYANIPNPPLTAAPAPAPGAKK